MASEDNELERARRALVQLQREVEEYAQRERARAEVEHALRASEQTLKLVMDTIPQRVFWKDRSSRFLGCNKAFAQDAGLESPDQLVGRTDADVAWHESAAVFQADDEAVMHSGEAKVDYEEPMLRSGEVRWLRTSKIPLRDPEGRIIGLFGCYEDVTERRRAADALVEREARYRTLVELASDGIFVSGPDGELQEANTTGCAMLGWDEGIPNGVTMAQLGIDPLAGNTIEPGDSAVLTRELVRHDGSTLDVEISARRHPDGRLHSIVRDVSERRRAQAERTRLEEQLRHAQKLESIGRLAGGVAHDFNNLLTVILANCGFLLSELASDDPCWGYAQLISEAGDRAAALTRQLLAFSRKQAAQPRLLDLGEVVVNAERMLRRVVGEDVALSVRTGPHAGLVLLDPGQIEQVLLNLVVNARDAMPQGGMLELGVDAVTLSGTEFTMPTVPAPGRHLALRVSDSGEGMDTEVLQRIFEPFFTTKDAGKGTGLGLATVYGIVTQAGGCLSVQSAPRQGTAFTLYFPLVQDISRPEPAPPELPACRPGTVRASTSHTILLAEDDANVACVARQALSSAGYELLVARGGLQALQIFARNRDRITLLLTDVVMPAMSGPELATELLLRSGSLRVLFISGYADESLDSRARLPNGTHLLRKPFSADRLVAAVQQVLAD